VTESTYLEREGRMGIGIGGQKKGGEKEVKKWRKNREGEKRKKKEGR